MLHFSPVADGSSVGDGGGPGSGEVVDVVEDGTEVVAIIVHRLTTTLSDMGFENFPKFMTVCFHFRFVRDRWSDEGEDDWQEGEEDWEEEQEWEEDEDEDQPEAAPQPVMKAPRSAHNKDTNFSMLLFRKC